MIHAMVGGIIEENIVFDANAGISISEGRRNIIYANKFFGDDDKALILDKESSDNRTRNNITFSRNRNVNGINGKYLREIEWQNQNDEEHKLYQENQNLLELLWRNEIDPVRLDLAMFQSEIKVSWKSKQDENIAETLRRYLERNNPGFLSVDVEGISIRSEITPDFYRTLRGSGELGIDLVRHLCKTPLLRLSVGDEEVAIVSRKRTAPGVQIFFKEEGRLSLAERLALAKNFLGLGLLYIERSSIKPIPILGIFLLGLVFGAWGIWRKRGKAGSEPAARLR
jgi:parallel beta-helix repeat protein